MASEGSEGHAGERPAIPCQQIRSDIFPTSLAGISRENPSRFLGYGDRRPRAPRPAPRPRDRGRARKLRRRRSPSTSPARSTRTSFRVFRLNQGIYGQRQGGHNQMLRVKIPYGRVDARAARDARLHRRDLLARLGPPHHPPERAVPLRRSSSRRPRCCASSRRSGSPAARRAATPCATSSAATSPARARTRCSTSRRGPRRPPTSSCATRSRSGCPASSRSTSPAARPTAARRCSTTSA